MVKFFPTWSVIRIPCNLSFFAAYIWLLFIGSLKRQSSSMYQAFHDPSLREEERTALYTSFRYQCKRLSRHSLLCHSHHHTNVDGLVPFSPTFQIPALTTETSLSFTQANLAASKLWSFFLEILLLGMNKGSGMQMCVCACGNAMQSNFRPLKPSQENVKIS